MLPADFSQYFSCPLKRPEAVDEAARLLLDVLDPQVQNEVASVSEDGLTDFHLGLGMAVRNAFGLHEPDSLLLAATGTPHPDDASGIILLALWQRLNRPLTPEGL
ncbi:DUF6794 domain-containing protein [Methylovulum psychrotolerans]|uniref:DUF6794 domain-containing protein n=1 Tax=Methylovulum psychrotolerans TaxID=1704499 RepID=A0A2S5CIQ3_9GAMM|nr:DUF6794 domain-containing protein [Methylovulum psychrotolerans]POZ50693.1 hypothetical protein AADEFJLK_03590 [Methylovulum psychrotolerans]